MPRISPFLLVVAAGAAVKMAIHLLTASNYGYFCDELYTISLSKHLAFGYVDLPPLVPALVALTRLVLGESLFALHIVPALAGAGTLIFVCLLTREMGGKLVATAIAAMSVLIAPVWLILDSFFCYDSIDQLLLAAFLFTLVRLIRTGNVRLWLIAGALAGVACLAKNTILFLGPGLLLALLATPRRKDLLSPWVWMGLAAFLAIISPYVAWEILNKWPTLDFWNTYRTTKLYHASPGEYLLSIAMTMNPAIVPLLLLGASRIISRFWQEGYRFLAILVVPTFVLLIALHARSFMLSELFIPVLAAGAILLEELTLKLRGKTVTRAAIFTVMAAGGILVLPSSVPLLPLPQLKAYARSFSFLWEPIKDFNDPKSAFPQEFSNRIGWDELVEQVAHVYNGLSAEDKKKVGIWGDWYGPAGAIDVLGAKYGLPHAVSGHMNYYLWGPGEYSWEVMIFVTGAMDQLKALFWEVDMKTVIQNDYAMPYNHNIIYVCRGPRMPPASIWKYLKNY
ncbi:MAG TPA: glycosyltransferase family 39 protein [Spirochaetia bacterium]|nr:glycosyltransferase family 39 protein [Spirochaetia bacterium]